jgi:hypothetical protein
MRVGRALRRSRSSNVPNLPRTTAGGFKRPPTKHGTFGMGQVRGYDGTFIKDGVGYMWSGLDNVVQRTIRRGKAIQNIPFIAMSDMAKDAQDYMQRYAPWNDRTGDARTSLQAMATSDGQGQSTMWLGHGVYYGYYLETMQGGRFAIVERTMHEFVGPNLEQYVKNADRGFA